MGCPRGVSMGNDVKKLPPDEIGDILRHIRDNLAFRPLLPRTGPRREDRNRFLPPLSQWEQKIHSLRRLQAPIVVPEGRGLAAWSRTLLNVPLHLFGHKQSQFNDLSVTLLGEMVQELHRAVTRQAQVIDSLEREV